jgi:hypothetical protein
MSAEVSVVYQRDGLRVATFGPLCITSIRGPITTDFFREANAAGVALARRHRGKIGALDLVSSDAPMPSAELRAQAAKLTQASSERVAAGASVVVGEGFKASAVRSVLTAVTLLGSGAPRRTFAQPGPALEWLAKQLGVGAGDLAPALEWSERTLRDGA